MSIKIVQDAAVSISASVLRDRADGDGPHEEPLWNITRKANEGYSWLSTGDGRYVFIGDDDVDAFVELATALRDHVRTEGTGAAAKKESAE